MSNDASRIRLPFQDAGFAAVIYTDAFTGLDESKIEQAIAQIAPHAKIEGWKKLKSQNGEDDRLLTLDGWPTSVAFFNSPAPWVFQAPPRFSNYSKTEFDSIGKRHVCRVTSAVHELANSKTSAIAKCRAATLIAKALSTITPAIAAEWIGSGQFLIGNDLLKLGRNVHEPDGMEADFWVRQLIQQNSTGERLVRIGTEGLHSFEMLEIELNVNNLSLEQAMQDLSVVTDWALRQVGAIENGARITTDIVTYRLKMLVCGTLHRDPVFEMIAT